jgi:hypothetical protein
VSSLRRHVSAFRFSGSRLKVHVFTSGAITWLHWGKKFSRFSRIFYRQMEMLLSEKGKMQFYSLSLNFVIHLIIAAELFAVDNFDVAHVVGLGVVLLLVNR